MSSQGLLIQVLLGFAAGVAVTTLANVCTTVYLHRGIAHRAIRFRRPADVDRILAEAHEHRGPSLVVAEVVKEDNVFPMIPAGAPVSAMIIEKPKERLDKPTGST